MAATMMYRTVQMSSEAMMPIGRSRCGFFASCAAVDTASNPMYAKKTTPAPVVTPPQPNAPRTPGVAGGMKGCQFAGTTACAAATMKRMTTATLISTMMSLTLADSLMPITSSVVTTATTITAGRLKRAVTDVPSAHVISVPLAPDSAHGTLMPMSRRNETTYPDQPIATVTAPSAYSRIRSQPMIHATSSPRVA